MTLSPRQWERIHANQARELDILVSDPESARRLALSASYGRVGAWLEPKGGERCSNSGAGQAVSSRSLHSSDAEWSASIPTVRRRSRLGHAVGTLPNVELRGGVRAESLPFEDGSFDHAACMGALLYFDDPVEALNELHRVVKPGGRLVLRTVNRENLFTALTGRRLDPASKNLYSSEELSALVESAGFRVADTFTFGFWPPACTHYWWYLVNTAVKPAMQRTLSALTPARRRVNITVLATRAPGRMQ